MICGLLAPAEGEIRWQGTNIHSLDEEYLTSLTYVGHRHGLKEELTSVENLRIATGMLGVKVNREEAARILEEMGLAGRENMAVRLLSEGQRRRSALGRLLACRTALWLLDEVFTSLDRSAVTLVKKLIEEHLRRGGMAIIATHQELDLSAGSFQRLELAT